MPNRDEHLGMATLIAIPVSMAIYFGYALVDLEPSQGPWALFAVAVDFFAVLIGASFPNILESPQSTRAHHYDQRSKFATHRQHWHSWEILGVTSLITLFSLLLGMNLLASSQFSLGTILMMTGCFCLGYAVHLWQDSYTTAGLAIRFTLTAKVLQRIGID